MTSDHAKQKEWGERPDYQDGLKAYELWSSIKEFGDFENYSTGWYYNARFFAVKYLQSISGDDELLSDITKAYENVAEKLSLVWNGLKDNKKPDDDTMLYIRKSIKEAGELENKAIELIDKWLIDNK